MKLSFRGVVYESPFPADDAYPISELPAQYAPLADHMSQIPGLQMPLRLYPAVEPSALPDPLHFSDAYPRAYTELLTPPAIAPALSPVASILVAIWETAPPNETRIRPFHFVAKYLFPSQQAVFDLLKQYYVAYIEAAAQVETGVAADAVPHFFIGVPSPLVQMATSL